MQAICFSEKIIDDDAFYWVDEPRVKKALAVEDDEGELISIVTALADNERNKKTARESISIVIRNAIDKQEETDLTTTTTFYLFLVVKSTDSVSLY